MRVLIVDDEPVARTVLREELAAIAGVQIAGEADTGLEAVRLIAEQKPDLVLLDLQMPGMSGLEVLGQLRRLEQMPVVVIVTAYHQHALEALDAGAIDYLLKPVRQERLVEAIERARRLSGREAAERFARLQELAAAGDTARARRIVGKLGEEYFLLPADEICAFQADGDLVWIIAGKRKYLATQTLRELEERLRHTSFRRIHRSVVVNVDHVRKMSALSSQRWLITMSNDQEFIASKRQARSVRELLSF